MPKIKIPKSSPSIDMTPMVDLAFLLVTFFMLAASFRPSEPVTVNTPSSTSDKILPENKLMVTVDNKGRAYLTIGDAEARKETINAVLAQYGSKLTNKELEEFYGLTTFGCAVKDLPTYLEASETERQRFESAGIPADSNYNELVDWLKSAITALDNRAVTLLAEAKKKGKTPNYNEIYPKLVIRADGKVTYADNQFQSSFVGYFPADNPQYTIAVVIINKPNIKNHYGGSVAGPVFKEISDRLYSTYIQNKLELPTIVKVKDTQSFQFSSSKAALKTIGKQLSLKYTDSSTNSDWVQVQGIRETISSINRVVSNGTMPNIMDMKLQDALWICEKNGLVVKVAGKGKVTLQSIAEGQVIIKGQQIQIQLN